MTESCDRTIDFARLVDYWLDRQDPPDEALEEHLFECGDCSERLQGFVSLGEGVRRVAHAGAVELVVTPSFLARAAQEGLRTREYRVAPGGRVDCTVTHEDDLLIARLQGNFGGISRLDVVAQTEGGAEQLSADVPIGPGATELILAQAMPQMRRLGASRHRFRLLGHGPAGERLIGEYTFDHTPAGR